MKKIERAQFVSKTLQSLFPETPIPLTHSDPFTLLIAVLLSAQSTDVSVNKVTPQLFKAAPNPYKMKQLGADKILEHIRTVGLAPSKAKNIESLCHMLIEKFNATVPQTFEELESLPGVGHKTASVVMSQAFGVPAFPVDTHIHRLMKRWKLSDGSSVTQTEKDAKKLFPESSWNTLHLQIIFFGRSYCPARGHIPAQCPICSILNPNVSF